MLAKPYLPLNRHPSNRNALIVPYTRVVVGISRRPEITPLNASPNDFVNFFFALFRPPSYPEWFLRTNAWARRDQPSSSNEGSGREKIIGPISSVTSRRKRAYADELLPENVERRGLTADPILALYLHVSFTFLGKQMRFTS